MATALLELSRGVVRGGSGGWSTPFCPGHKANVNVQLLTDSHLPWQKHRLYTCMQAKIEVQSSNIGVWSRCGACANLSTVAHAQESELGWKPRFLP